MEPDLWGRAACGAIRVVLWVALWGLLLPLSAVLYAQDPTPQGASQGAQPGAASGQGAISPGTPSAVPQASQTTQPQPSPSEKTLQQQIATAAANLHTPSIWTVKGLPVLRIEFLGVTYGPNDLLPGELTQKAGEPLDPDKVRESTRRLFASGKYRDIAVRGEREAEGIVLIYDGVPQFFVGRVTIHNVSSERLSSLLEFATKLDPGKPFTEALVPAGSEGIRLTLEQNGYYQPKIVADTHRDDVGRQIDVTYTVDIGPQARVGDVVLVGADPGLSEKELRKKGKLKRKNRVNRDTTNNALDGARGIYQKHDRLEGTITLTKEHYEPQNRVVNYTFDANQGPVVKVAIEGVKVSKSRLKLLVPIYEEGTVDNDLLNEGKHNISDYMQQQGYFDAQVEFRVLGEDTPAERVVYNVDKGKKHKVVDVSFAGNKYFSSDILRERVRVQKADAFIRSGRYSQNLVNADKDAIEGIYRANGFNAVAVTADVKDEDERDGKELKVATITVKYTVAEGPQQRFGTVTLSGVEDSRRDAVARLMNTQTGQPFSLQTLSGDRDAVLGYFLTEGFDQVKVEVKQQVDPKDATRTDVTLNVTPGQPVAIEQVLRSGLHHTRPSVVDSQTLVHPRDPLNQTALLQTQRNLYGLALFNEVNAAVQNPLGDTPQKNVLLQLTEAKRWDVTYGFGFEAQTGRPTRGKISQASCIQLQLPPDQCDASQNGKTGVSPRVSLDVTRINLRGTQQSLTLHTAYGLLETIATLSLQSPNLRGNPNLTASVTGGYTNVQNISTFAASTLQGDVRVTQKARRTDTFIYDFQYRRVKVDPNSLQVSANLIPLLSQPVRVGGPGVSWYHDRRYPTALDATRGSYTTVQTFFASSKFGSQTDFNKFDGSNATYYQFGKKNKYVFARNTRFGYEGAYGTNPNAIPPQDPNAFNPCAGNLLNTNPSCTAVPLPERLYAGGATSHRGFSINGAGPRDLQTGYPVGGTAVFVNSLELRLPPPVLPVVGSSVNFVAFHDMGNVFQHLGDLWPSIGRFRQPNQSTCRVTNVKIGTCDFNYFSHAIGLGARYNTPVGPLRADFSYNLNPPIYPVIYDFNNSVPHVGQASHFNFFFSIGQAF